MASAPGGDMPGSSGKPGGWRPGPSGTSFLFVFVLFPGPFGGRGRFLPGSSPQRPPGRREPGRTSRNLPVEVEEASRAPQRQCSQNSFQVCLWAGEEPECDDLGPLPGPTRPRGGLE